MTDTRTLVRGLGTTAAVLGVLAAAVGAPVRPERPVRWTLASAATRDAFDDCARDDSVPAAPLPRSLAAPQLSSRASEASRGICTSPISALQLAQWIRDGLPGLRVLDLRDSSAFATRHIPSAESVELLALPSVPPKPGETLVIYSDDGLRDAQGVAWLAAIGHRRVHVVRGGMAAWMTEVVDHVVQGDSAATVSALSRYFGGVPRAEARREDARDARATRLAPEPRIRNATDEFGFAPRRGC